MLDGAEDILREEGHAELTSRRIAERIGVKQRLVYYYFHTMDDLVVALFKRSSERDLQRLRDASASQHSVRELWQLCYNSHDARLISEYTALAHRIPELRREVIDFIELSRRIQVDAIAAALAKAPNDRQFALPPVVIATLATSLGLSLNREGHLGVEMGHEETKSVIERFLKAMELK